MDTSNLNPSPAVVISSAHRNQGAQITPAPPIKIVNPWESKFSCSQKKKCDLHQVKQQRYLSLFGMSCDRLVRFKKQTWPLSKNSAMNKSGKPPRPRGQQMSKTLAKPLPPRTLQVPQKMFANFRAIGPLSARSGWVFASFWAKTTFENSAKRPEVNMCKKAPFVTTLFSVPDRRHASILQTKFARLFLQCSFSLER